MLSRDQILALDDLGFEVVEVPAWGGPVGIRELTAGERDDFELYVLTTPRPKTRAALLVRVLVDPETRQRVFRDEDVEDLARQGSRVIAPLWIRAAHLSALSDADVDELGKVSAAVRREPSSSALQPSSSAAPSPSSADGSAPES